MVSVHMIGRKVNNMKAEAKIWTSRILDFIYHKGIRSHLLASIFVFGLPIDILLAVFLFNRKDFISPQFFLAYILCILWLNLGPYFIWYYENQTMKRFFKEVNGLISKGEIQKLQSKYSKSFSKKYWIPIIPWMFFLFAVYGESFALDVAGTFGYDDIWTWLLTIPIVWIPVIAGMGTWGVITTIAIINESTKKELRLDSFHSDRRGGLGCIGNYAINTTLLISSGSLFLPMAFQLASQLSYAKFNIYILVVFFIMILLFSFFYPILITQSGAIKQRAKLLERLRHQYNKALDGQKIPKTGINQKLIFHLNAARIRTEYLDLININLYPFDISIINKLVSSILFPIIITFLQQFIGWK